MTTEQFEQQFHDQAPAVHYLRDAVADFLLNRGHAAKIGEIASQAGKRIGAGVKLIQQTLATSPQFVGEERRWNLTLRTQFHRPIEGALQHTMRLYGRPITIAALSNEMAVLNARAPEFFQQFLPAFLTARPQTYFETPDERWGITEWLLDTSPGDDEHVLLRNFFDTLEEVRPLLDQALALPLTANMAPGDAAILICSALRRPVHTKIMSYAMWRLQGEAFDAQEFYLTLLTDARLVLLSGAEWIRAEDLPELNTSLQQLSALADTELEEEEAWEGPFTVSPEDLDEIFDFMIEQNRPQKLSDLIEAVLEYGKSSPRYQAVFDGLMAELQHSPRFQQVGIQTWTLPELIPQEVMQVPETLLPETLDPSLLPDPETDAELEDEGLEDNLALWVHDPRYEDFGGEHEVELSPELMGAGATLDETRVPLLFDHHQMGTLKLRQADMAFFPTETPLACVTMHGEGYDTFQIWINNEELLIHGLTDWYQARRVPVGAVLTIRRGIEPDDFTIAWEGEIDELIALPAERIAALQNLREPAEEGHWSVYQIMRNVMAGHPEGMHFLTLWAEVNVVRRTPKRVIASNLSSYHCFSLISNSERWKIDERKVDQGRKKTKKKNIIQ